MGFLQIGKFTLHSGKESDFKIDCDELTSGEVEAAAYLLSKKLHPFKKVEGIPRGGLRLAEAMERYVDPEAKRLLVVDDVWTTGNSFREHCAEKMEPLMGAVIFSRTTWLPAWVTPLFVMSL